ncbi:unnamed protein product [Soboliphyme baturini]|uniref:Transcription initiation factor IIE subunit beta n=1 Tax=Soboliphyme baturini TaxID=241478 RepID=A0A183INC8_9BILA|nr:unnamed protein product [Soboliphyme baturini]
MDASLLKQHSVFMKRAASQPTIFNVGKRSADQKEEKGKKSKTLTESKTVYRLIWFLVANFDYKTAKASMAASFGVLAKIVDHMKKRHLEQSNWSLSLEEIFEELQMFDLTMKTKYSNQLTFQVLPQNRRISSDEDGKFIYKPPYKVKGKNSLINVLKRHDLEGKGGVLMSELADCIPMPEKIVQASLSLEDAVSVIPVNVNKRKDMALFYNDPESSLKIDEEFKGLWRSIAVDHLDEKKIAEYLRKHSIDSMKDLAPKKLSGAGMNGRRKAARKRNVIIHNEHLAQSGLLKDYSTTS